MNKQIKKTEVTLVFDRFISEYTVANYFVNKIIDTFNVSDHSSTPVRLGELFPNKPVYILPIYWRKKYIAGIYGSKDDSSDTTLTIHFKGSIDDETLEEFVTHAQNITRVHAVANIESIQVNKHIQLL